MGGGEVIAWLAKTIGAHAIKDRMGRSSLKRQNAMLAKALEDSQNRRGELEDAGRIVAEIARQRDQYFSEIVKLRAENVALRAALEKLGKGD
ncbi:MAG: hypothetical protein K2X59_01080 [Sphingomonas sp.]|nr:hypothetical protein [Sphingomonas sp.]